MQISLDEHDPAPCTGSTGNRRSPTTVRRTRDFGDIINQFPDSRPIISRLRGALSRGRGVEQELFAVQEGRTTMSNFIAN